MVPKKHSGEMRLAGVQRKIVNTTPRYLSQTTRNKKILQNAQSYKVLGELTSINGTFLATHCNVFA